MAPETLDSLPKDSLKPLLLQLLAQNGELIEQVKRLLARIAELESRAGQPPQAPPPPKTPTNSSLPPSKGQKANVSEPAAKKARKGRPGVARELSPNPDATRDIHAGRCACGTALSPAGQTIAHAYDHIDLPPIKPVTTRITLHRAVCPCCAKRVTAKPPAGMVPGSPFGPGIVATVAYLHGCHMVSYSRLTEVLDGLFGLKVSEGAIANMLARSAKLFAKAADGIAETVRTSPVIASDETSARVCGKTWWQWVFGSATAVYHTIAPTRGKTVPVEFLGGARPDVWISDRLAAQCKHAAAHQFCLAHLIRDAQYARCRRRLRHGRRRRHGLCARLQGVPEKGLRHRPAPRRSRRRHDQGLRARAAGRARPAAGAEARQLRRQPAALCDVGHRPR